MLEEEGLKSVSDRGARIAAALRNMALLIGEPREQTVKLDGKEVAPGLGLNSLATSLEQSARDISQGIFKVLVVGQFKNGKSTLLNALLGEAALPARNVPCTAVISVIVHGTNDQVAIFEHGKETPRMLAWEQFIQEFRLSPEDQRVIEKNRTLDRFQHVQFVQIERTFPLCANGVRLIDSPGLGEALSRTQVTTGFLQQSHAVVFVIDATKFLGIEERQFIEEHLQRPWFRRTNSVFFVVNKIDLVKPREIASTREWIQDSLKPYFTNSRGQLDSRALERRVFFVNSEQALDARMAQPKDEQALEASGLQSFEQELEAFLTGPDKVAAAFATPIRAMRWAIRDAQQDVAHRKVALDQPLNELESRRVDAEKKFGELDKQRRDIERTIRSAAEVVKTKVYADLLTYVNEMHDTWPRDSGLETQEAGEGGEGTAPLIDLSELKVSDVVKAAAQSTAARQRVEELLESQLQGYLLVKFEHWATRIPDLVRPEVESMEALVGEKVAEFEFKLDSIKSVFAGPVEGGFLGTLDENKGSKMAMGMLSAIAFDPSNFAASLMGRGDWSGFVSRLVTQVLIAMALASVLSGGALLVAFLFVEAVLIAKHMEEFKRKLLAQVGEKLHGELRQMLPGKQSEVAASVMYPFEQFLRAVSTTLEARISEARTELDTLIEQKRREDFSVAREKERLDIIGEQLGVLLKEVESTADVDAVSEDFSREPSAARFHEDAASHPA